MDATDQLDIADYLALAEAITGIDAHVLADNGHVVALAESALAAPFAGFGEEDFYPGLALKAAVLCSRLVRNHPLPDGNKRCAYLAMIELVRRNGAEWTPDTSVDERAQVIEDLASGDLTEEDFAAWVERQVQQ